MPDSFSRSFLLLSLILILLPCSAGAGEEAWISLVHPSAERELAECGMLLSRGEILGALLRIQRLHDETLGQNFLLPAHDC